MSSRLSDKEFIMQAFSDFSAYFSLNHHNTTPHTIYGLFKYLFDAYTTWWIALYREAPIHVYVETSLVLFIVWLLFIRRTVDPDRSKKKSDLTDKEIDWLVETWQPEPLVSTLPERNKRICDRLMIIDSMDGNYAKIRGKDLPILNLSSFDFLGLGQLEAVKVASREALEFYGCGSCGPRGFYGTIDQHLKLEAAIANFMRTPEAISYSDSASTVSSTIPAFAKRGDLLLVDEACAEPIQTGLMLSRGTVQTFRHNDMTHLHMMLESIAADDIRLKRDSLQQRRFIVVEGLYRNCGDLCPLPELIHLKEKFCYRLILDESLSFGVIGSTGRGVTEHFGVSIDDVEMITVAMDTSLASVGGLCIGSKEVVDHQRLSGTGYCYSAAAPPFMSAAALVSLAELQRDPSRLQRLHENTRRVADGISGISGLLLTCGDASSSTPVLHIRLKHALPSFEEEEEIMRRFSDYCIDHGIGVSCTNYQSSSSPWILHQGMSKAGSSMPSSIRPSIRIIVTSLLSASEISDIIRVLTAAATAII